MRSSARGWLIRALIAGAVLLLVTAGQSLPAAAAVRPPLGRPAVAAGPMVVLGDSYTAGALLPVEPFAHPPGCLRSPRAYPAIVARALGLRLIDAACSGAGVKDMTAPQRTRLGTNRPQLTVLSSRDTVVALTLGGDDVGFMNVLDTCMKLSFTDPWGSPCKARFTRGGTDRLAARIRIEAPRLARVLALIAARAPLARIVVVGYPDLFPLRGGCWPRVPITNGDIAYLRGLEVRLNAMIAAEAAKAGDTFVNTYRRTIGHDFCARESARDMEGLIPGSLALPFHPNGRGQLAMATAVLAALRG